MVVLGSKYGRVQSPWAAERRARRRAMTLVLAGLLAVGAGVGAQSPQPDSGNAQAQPAPTATLHGVVKDAVTGEPLARVLVRVGSQSSTAALTDGDGRFEITGVPAGSAVLQLTKPGFIDSASGSPAMAVWQNNGGGYDHVVAVVGQEMPDLEFAMRPSNAIRGQIELSTGDPAEKLAVELLARSVLDGREAWRTAARTQTNADGAFRFGNLSDGTYALVTQPSLEGGDPVVAPASGSAASAVRQGYAQKFYPDAREFSGAARIRVAGGQTAQANMMLKLEPFYPVRVAVSGPGLNAVGGARLPGGAVVAPMGMSAALALNSLQSEVADTEGRVAPYPALYESSTHTVQALLPDGDFVLRVTAQRPNAPIGPETRTVKMENLYSGQTDVSVAGHAVNKLRIALGPDHPSPLHVMVNRTSAQALASSGNGGGISVAASQAGPGSTDAMSSQFAQGDVSGTGSLYTSYLGPGSYWVHTTVAQAGLCEASFTAGGANLAREPLIVGQGGSTAPLTLTLRDDCATLKLTLPYSPSVTVAGEVPVYTVYVVPDFDSTTEVPARTLRPSSGAPLILDNLTPGNYHVYTFAAPLELEYHDQDVMASLPSQGQAFSLSPGATTDLVLEVPAQ